MIREIKEYIMACDLLQGKTIKVDYLGNKIESFSVNENAGYEPLIEEDIIGNRKCQFQFNLDGKFHWNDEEQNNIDNSEFFEDFNTWLKNKNANSEFPNIASVEPVSIEAITGGYIFAAESDEAIYRISCRFIYWESPSGETLLG